MLEMREGSQKDNRKKAIPQEKKLPRLIFCRGSI